MAKYLVTGGTGLIGSNVCRLMIEAGDQVRALVRPGSEYEQLEAIGVETFQGDIQSGEDFLRAAEGCEAIVHSAALLGGNAQDMAESQKSNAEGAYHAYDAAAKHGFRVVALSSTPFFKHETTLTEDAEVADNWSDDPYTLTKGAAYVEAMRRVAESGEDIVITIPGGTFGPGLVLSRAMSRTSFNRAIRAAVNGKIHDYVSYPVPWVFAEDVAAGCVAAITKGTKGRKYLLFGKEDAQTNAVFLNTACEVAGVDHRVAELKIDPNNPEHVATYGETLVELAQRHYPVPWFDNTITRQDLGYAPRSLREAMEQTIPWLRENNQI
jgi:dihydroflavonol-4-reductase